MARVLSGSLKHLAPPALLRLISATGASGVLDLVTDAGSARLGVRQGGICAPTGNDLRSIGKILNCIDGAYRFTPDAAFPENSDVILDASDFLSAARDAGRSSRPSYASELDVDALIAGEVLEVSQALGRPDIHVLPEEPSDNPLEDLLNDLEETAPEELLLSQVAVVAADPRTWRGALVQDFRRRGWEVSLFGVPTDVSADELDLCVIHHQLSITRTGREDDWIELVRRLADARIPVIWVGPLGDPVWVGQLVDAGISFLLPAPQGDAGGEAGQRFVNALATVIDRLLRMSRQAMGETDTPRAVADLVDTLLHEVSSDDVLGSLLQLAATQLQRGAVFSVEDTVIRCRAGFGYQLNPGVVALPRGLGLLERIINAGGAVFEIDASGRGAEQLARVLGESGLPTSTAVIPMGTRTGVSGILVGDRDGQALPDLDDLTMFATRLGGVFI